MGPGPRFGNDWRVGLASIPGPSASQAHEGTQEPAGAGPSRSAAEAACPAVSPPRSAAVAPHREAWPPPHCTLCVSLVRLASE